MPNFGAHESLHARNNSGAANTPTFQARTHYAPTKKKKQRKNQSCTALFSARTEVFVTFVAIDQTSPRRVPQRTSRGQHTSAGRKKNPDKEFAIHFFYCLIFDGVREGWNRATRRWNSTRKNAFSFLVFGNGGERQYTRVPCV
jgi:hypothetical protein